MFRLVATKSHAFSSALVAPSRVAYFSVSSRFLSEGSVGSPPKTGGAGDAFQRRERAAEDMAVRQRELEKLRDLKKRISEQQAHLDQLSEHIDEITKQTKPGNDSH